MADKSGLTGEGSSRGADSTAASPRVSATIALHAMAVHPPLLTPMRIAITRRRVMQSFYHLPQTALGV